MKWLVLALSLLQIPSPPTNIRPGELPDMAIAVRTISTPARNVAHSPGTGENYTITSTTAGDLLIAYVAWFQDNGAVVTGITGGGTWAEAATQDLDANSHQAIWYAHDVSGSVTTLTVTLNGTGNDGALQVTVIHASGAATASALDVTPTATTGTSNAPAITTGVLAQADELVVQMTSHTGADLTSMTEDSGDGFSQAAENLDNDLGQTFHAQYKVVAATTSLTVNTSFNASRAWGAIAASFMGAEAAGGSILKQITQHWYRGHS